MAIAKECISNINTCNHKDRIRMQAEISKIRKIYPGVGLPPAYMESLKDDLKQYFIKNFKRYGENFNYNYYYFSLRLKDVYVFSQDYAAIFDNKTNGFIAKTFPYYYGIDIGGGTPDVVPIVDGKVDKNNCFSRS